MATKPNNNNRRPKRRAERILERARLKARVITAEAGAAANDVRMAAMVESRAENQRVRAETERVRAEAEAEALRTMEQAHREAGWILTQARGFADAEARARTAEADLAAERLRSSAAVA